MSSLLPLLLLGGGGGHGRKVGLGGKGGHVGNPLLLLSLLGSGAEKCKEIYPKCIQPTTANADGRRKCGLDNGNGMECETTNDAPANNYPALCLPCCSCPNTPDAVLEPFLAPC